MCYLLWRIYEMHPALSLQSECDNGKLYLVDFTKENVDLDACLIAKTILGCLWYLCLAHVGMKNLHKLLKGEHILGLTNVHFEKDRICSACQAGWSPSSTQEHNDDWHAARTTPHGPIRPIAYINIGKSKYCLVIVNDYSRFTWVFFFRKNIKPKIP